MLPSWARGAVYYQIFIDRFCNGDASNDVATAEYSYNNRYPVIKAQSWNEEINTFDVNHFYGGDLEGVWDKFPYLKELGVEVILFNPIFVSPSNHKYDVEDYDNIDPHLTSKHARNQEDDRELTPNEYFVYFMKAAHEAGFRVVLDGVFNHCSITNAWVSDTVRSNYFKKKSDGSLDFWWDVETLPKINYDESPEAIDEIMRIARKWVSAPHYCDGWRLDVAPELGYTPETNHAFWKRFNAEVKAANPEAVVFAEIYDDPETWLKNSEWDSVMNYRGFFDPVSYFFTGMEKHSDGVSPELLANAEAFAKMLKSGMDSLPGDIAFAALNQLDNHDHSRFITRTNGRVGRLAEAGTAAAGEGVRLDAYLAAIVFQMTYPGAPGIYYGDEAALCGWTDPDSRRAMPWDKPDYRLYDFYKQVIKLHKLPALKVGTYKLLCTDGGVFAFMREKAGKKIVVVINMEDNDREIQIEVAGTVASRLLVCNGGGYNVGAKQIELSEGGLSVIAPRVSAAVYEIS